MIRDNPPEDQEFRTHEVQVLRRRIRELEDDLRAERREHHDDLRAANREKRALKRENAQIWRDLERVRSENEELMAALVQMRAIDAI